LDGLTKKTSSDGNLFSGAGKIPHGQANDWKKQNEYYPKQFLARCGTALNGVRDGPNVCH